MLSALYICYFGIREPLVQTQVVPYLRQLAQSGVNMHLLTFEPQPVHSWPAEERAEIGARLEAEGIHWHTLRYHKRPTLPATLYDIVRGAQFARRLIRRERLDILHARSHVAAAIGALAKLGTRARLLFDIRGFLPEEYTDAGVWPRGGYLYRIAKAAERWLLSSADGFVVLTEKAREILFPEQANGARRQPIEVIPCCVDLERFAAAAVTRSDVRRELGLSASRRVVVYVGSLGGWYLTDETADLLAAAHRQDPATFSLILTQSRPEMITARLRAGGVSERDYLVQKVGPPEIPHYLKSADVGVSFIKPCYSKLSSSPTKMAEYLAAGVPVICNAGIGDLDELIETKRVGVLLREFDEISYLRALADMAELQRDPDLVARCQGTAAERFDLVSIGGARYRRLYERLVCSV